jgi:cell division transport system ATP-binding protein
MSDLLSTAPAEPPVVRLESASLDFPDGRPGLRDIGFALPRGSFHFLTGESGAGKSTLLGLLHLERLPAQGRMQLFGTDVAAADRATRAALRQRIGVVFQDFRLIDHLDVLANTCLPLAIAGADPEPARRKAIEILESIGLGATRDAFPPTLSGGQKLRLAIARALVTQPALLLADEPTANVDDPLADRLVDLLDAMHRLGTTVVVATHHRRLIERLGHPVLRLAAGRLVDAPASSQGARA